MNRNRTNLPNNPHDTTTLPITDSSNQQTEFQTEPDPVQKTNEGLGDAIKEGVKEEQKAKEKLDSLVEQSQQIVYQLSTVFPFDFFPTNIIIDLNKISIVDKIFIGSQKVHSIFITNITDVLVHLGLFFATLEVIDMGFVENSIKIPKLKKDEARRARRLIQGLIIAQKREVDLSKMENTPDLVNKLETLGQSVDRG